MNKKNLNYIILIFFPFLILLAIMLYCNNFYLSLFTYFLNYVFLLFTFLKRKKFNLLSIQFLFTIYHMAYIGLCPIFLYLQYLLLGKDSTLITSILNSNDFFSKQCFYILVSYFVFLIATTIFSNDKDIDYSENNIIKINDKKIIPYSKIVSYIMIAFSFICEAIYIFNNKSILFAGSLESGRIEAMSGNGILLYGMWIGTFGIAMLYEIILRKNLNKKFFILLVLIHIFSISLIGFRSRVIVLLLYLLIVGNRYKKIEFGKLIRIGIYLIIIVAFMTIGRNILSGVTNSSILNTIVSSFANGSINIYYVLRQFPLYTPFQHGYTYIIDFLMLAPGNQADFTIWLKDIIGISFSGGGITPTLLGESWMNYGFIGILIVFFVSGIICNKIDKWYYKTKNVYFVLLFIWVVTSSVRGGYSNSLINLFIYFIMNLFIYLLFSKGKN